MQAVCRLASLLGEARLLLSPYVCTRPQGFESDNDFVNLGVLILLPATNVLTPSDVLQITQTVERSLSQLSHRNPDGSYRDRLIDIDIIDIDGIVMDTPHLQLPHPRAAERNFVVEPMQWLNQHY